MDARCDECGEMSHSMDLTMLAGGGWDDRNVKPELKRMGWTIDGERTVCPECSHPNGVRDDVG